MPYEAVTFQIDTSLFKSKKTIDIDEAHKWGYEVRLVNNGDYCGKLLVLLNRHQSSLHYHGIKRETFIILFGSVRITTMAKGKAVPTAKNKWWCPAVDTPKFPSECPLETSLYQAGDQITLSPLTAHRFSLADNCAAALILEVSTEHRDSDTVRIEESI